MYKKPYFDFDSLTSIQVVRLIEARSSVTKTTTLNAATEEVTFVPDSAGWVKELEVFRQLDVFNKPGFKGMYKITEGEKDNQSNLLIRRYESTLAHAPVTSVVFYYQQEFTRLYKVEAAMREENPLFTTSRVLELEFDEISGHHLLSQYKLTGVQKMVFGDSLHLSIAGSIVPGVF